MLERAQFLRGFGDGLVIVTTQVKTALYPLAFMAVGHYAFALPKPGVGGWFDGGQNLVVAFVPKPHSCFNLVHRRFLSRLNQVCVAKLGERMRMQSCDPLRAVMATVAKNSGGRLV